MRFAWLSWFSVAVCAASLALFAYTFQQRASDQAQVEELARQTNEALCTFKADLERRYLAGVEFLDRNPDGIPGVSRADIARSLSNQKATLEALATLECA